MSTSSANGQDIRQVYTARTASAKVPGLAAGLNELISDGAVNFSSRSVLERGTPLGAAHLHVIRQALSSLHVTDHANILGAYVDARSQRQSRSSQGLHTSPCMGSV